MVASGAVGQALRQGLRPARLRAGPAPATWGARGFSWDAMAPSAGAAQKPPIQLHDGAVRKLKSLQEQQMPSVLRLTVNSGGCSGYSYAFDLVDAAEGTQGNIVVERDGARLVVDEVSLSFLEDCEVDYVEEMIRSSFQVVKNKLADSKCGCGSSFNIAF
uniref:Core domain-containing protein n=1 Tax=Alexandrium monilatum TaxID=311494 RepID=A0A6T1KJX9_9DINO